MAENPIRERERLMKQLTEWIDAGVIAQAIIDDMQEYGLPQSEITLETAKKIWLGFLENQLRDGLKTEVGVRLDCL